MTDEQIKQKAEEYLDENFCPLDVDRRQYAAEDFIEGYHSRDEEIKELRLQRSEYEDKLRISEHHEGLLREEVNRLDELNNELKKTIDFLQNQLRNPWISVEDRLPKPSKMPFHYHRQVLVTRKGIDTAFMANFCEDGKWYTLDGVLTEIVAPDYWMPIPELKKV